MLRASAGNGNAAIGSRAPIGRAWSCRNPFGRHASFDHQRKLCGSFLAPGSRHRGQASCGSPKAQLEGKDSPNRQKARGWVGRSVCENRMLQCGAPGCCSGGIVRCIGPLAQLVPSRRYAHRTVRFPVNNPAIFKLTHFRPAQAEQGPMIVFVCVAARFTERPAGAHGRAIFNPCPQTNVSHPAK